MPPYNLPFKPSTEVSKFLQFLQNPFLFNLPLKLRGLFNLQRFSKSPSPQSFHRSGAFGQSLYIYPSISIYPPIHQSLCVYRSIDLSIYPSIHPSSYLSSQVFIELPLPCGKSITPAIYLPLSLYFFPLLACVIPISHSEQKESRHYRMKRRV